MRIATSRTVPAEAAAIGESSPTMIRAYHGTHVGATAFFRNRPFLDILSRQLSLRCAGTPRVLFHACSVGAEPYSLGAWWCRHYDRPIDIVATDIDERFLEVAREAIYPEGAIEGLDSRERLDFETRKDGRIRVADAVRRLVRFLPARSFLTCVEGERFDAVLIMNALTYVTPREQSVAIAGAAVNARHLLGLTAFHPDSIATDLASNGFAPLRDRQREIHDAWGDRLVTDLPKRGTPEYSWQLPSFDTAMPDRDTRFCSLFARCNAEAPAAAGITSSS
jgi:hypothetical protein